MDISQTEGNALLRTCAVCGKATAESTLQDFAYRCPACGFELAYTETGPTGSVRRVLAYLKCAGDLIHERYRVEKVLGKGGFGATYLVEDLKIKGKRRALKEIPEAFFDDKEVDLLGRLRHTAIPDVTDQFDCDGMRYLVLQFGGKSTLATRCRELGGRIPLTTAIPWMRQLCDVLAYLHTQNPPIIHRDLKPENVLLDDNDHIMLIDFGIAKAADPATTTRLLARAFTHGFSPPEQVLGVGTEARSDIYSFGATFYYLLTGQVPPPAHERLAGRALAAPSSLVAELGPEVDRILTTTLNLNVDQRPASVRELASMLQVLDHQPPGSSPYPAKTSRLDEEGGAALGIPSWTPVKGIKLSEAEPVAFSPDIPRAGRKRALMVIIAVTILLAAALGAGAYFFLEQKKTTPAEPIASPVEPSRVAEPAAAPPAANPVAVAPATLPEARPEPVADIPQQQPSASAAASSPGLSAPASAPAPAAAAPAAPEAKPPQPPARPPSASSAASPPQGGSSADKTASEILIKRFATPAPEPAAPSAATTPRKPVVTQPPKSSEKMLPPSQTPTRSSGIMKETYPAGTASSSAAGSGGSSGKATPSTGIIKEKY